MFRMMQIQRVIVYLQIELEIAVLFKYNILR